MRWPLVIGLLALLGACTAPPEDPNALTLWHAYRGAEADALNAAGRAFEAANPGVTVRLVSIPYDAFPDKIGVAVPRGNGPDLFIFAHDRVGAWAASGLLEPVGLRADEATADRFFAATLSALVYRGELYGLPLAFKSLALYYDTTLVASAPRDTDALIAAAKAARAANPEVWGLGYELDSLYFHAPWLHGFGGQVYADDQDTVALDSPEAAASVAFVRRLVADEKIVPEEVTNALVTSLFREHKLAFAISGPWFRGELEGHGEWAVAPLPIVSETGLPAKPFLGVEGVLVSARSGRKALAYRFADFLTQDAAAEARIAVQLVANRAAYDGAVADPFARAFRAQVDQTVPLSNRPHMRRVWTPMKSALSSGIARGAPPAEVLREAVRTIQRDVE